MKKSVLLLSGGLDSVVCLYDMADRNLPVVAITFSDNSNTTKNDAEVESAKFHTKILGVEHKIIPIDTIETIISFDKHLQFAVGGDMGGCTKGSHIYANLSVETMHILGLMFAVNSRAKNLIWTIQKDDFESISSLKDTKVYLKLLEKIVKLRTGIACGIETPFINMSKSSIIELGFKLNVPFERTFSCYENNNKPCGTCVQCQKRAKAFLISGKQEIDFQIHELA